MKAFIFPSESLGDIQYAHTHGVWQYGCQGIGYKNHEPGIVVVMKMNGKDTYYVTGLTRTSTKKCNGEYNDWPSRLDIPGIKQDKPFIVYFLPRTTMKCLTKAEIREYIPDIDSVHTKGGYKNISAEAAEELLS